MVAACAIGALAFALQEVADGGVALRGCANLRLPEVCFSRRWLGVKCPGCGLTRAIIHLSEGDLKASWRSHRLGIVIAVVIAVQVPYRLLDLRRGEAALIRPRWQALLGYALIALLLGNWLVELAMGRLGSV
jgi:hypothetical protein